MTQPNAAPSRAPAAGAPARAPLIHRVLRRPARRVLERFFDFRVDGVEHLPAAGPYIVAANHNNYLDGVVLTLALARPIAFIVMPRVYRATPLHPFLHRHVGSIPISLERPDVALLAPRSGAPVVPAGIRGTYEALRGRRGHVPRRHPLSVRFGPPRRYSPDGLRGRRPHRP